MTIPKSKRVLMLFLDAADIEYLHAHRSRLPHLRQLFDAARLLRLSTTAEVLDASVWPTFALGTMPGEHGMYFPFQFDPERMAYRRITEGWLPYEPFWEGLGARGIPTMVLDMPMMPKPLTPKPGVDYFHWHTQDEGRAVDRNRTTLAQDIVNEIGPCPLGYDVAANKTERQLQTLRRNAILSARKRAELIRRMMARTAWRLLICGFSELHCAGHYLWPDPQDAAAAEQNSELLSVYQAVDAAIGAILQDLDVDSTSVIVFALHGMGPNNSQAHFMPQILDRFNALFRGESSGYLGRGLRQPYMRMLRERLPGQLQYWAATSVSQQARDWVVNRTFTRGLDWQRTPGFVVLSGGQGFVRCNLRGREAVGVLERGSPGHLDYLRRLQQALFDLKASGDREPLVKSITLIPERLPGAHCDYLPDLSVVWRDRPPAREIRSEALGTFTGKIRTGRGGNHRPSAFALVTDKTGRPAGGDEPQHIMALSKLVERMLGA